jgi:hypothetical protein
MPRISRNTTASSDNLPLSHEKRKTRNELDVELLIRGLKDDPRAKVHALSSMYRTSCGTLPERVEALKTTGFLDLVLYIIRYARFPDPAVLDEALGDAPAQPEQPSDDQADSDEHAVTERRKASDLEFLLSAGYEGEVRAVTYALKILANVLLHSPGLDALILTHNLTLTSLTRVLACPFAPSIHVSLAARCVDFLCVGDEFRPNVGFFDGLVSALVSRAGSPAVAEDEDLASARDHCLRALEALSTDERLQFAIARTPELISTLTGLSLFPEDSAASFDYEVAEACLRILSNLSKMRENIRVLRDYEFLSDVTLEAAERAPSADVRELAAALSELLIQD